MNVENRSQSSESVVRANFKAAQLDANLTHLVQHVPQGEDHDLFTAIRLPASPESIEGRLASLFKELAVKPNVVAVYDLSKSKAANAHVKLDVAILHDALAR